MLGHSGQLSIALEELKVRTPLPHLRRQNVADVQFRVATAPRVHRALKHVKVVLCPQ